ILEPTSRRTEAEEFDMSGAALMTEAPAFSVIKIIRVRPDSPAAKAGLQQQDTIIAVDGQPAATLGVIKIRKMFRVEGREYVLTVKRGDEVLQMAIKLRR